VQQVERMRGDLGSFALAEAKARFDRCAPCVTLRASVTWRKSRRSTRSLILYAMTGLVAFRLSPPKRWEAILSPVVGAITGLITAATGVFVIPAVPYLQAIGFEKEELVQALGLSFTVSTVALAFNVAFEGGLRLTMTSDTFVALLFACVGMALGQAIRLRVSPSTFQRSFFAGVLLIGIYLMLQSVV
jgi:uncharacterized protein